MKLDCDRLPVYREALVFRALVEQIVAAAPRGQSDLSAQLRSAANSIVTNICEGAGEFVPTEKVRFYRYARRSATECVGTVDVFETIDGIAPEKHVEARMTLCSIISQLVLLIKRVEESDPSVREGRKAERQRAERQEAGGLFTEP